jgi:hypothetical protein
MHPWLLGDASAREEVVYFVQDDVQAEDENW